MYGSNGLQCSLTHRCVQYFCILFINSVQHFHSHHPVQGFTFYDGPVWAKNIWFDDFVTTSSYKAGAIGYELLNDFTSSAVSTVRNAKFGFVDGVSI